MKEIEKKGKNSYLVMIDIKEHFGCKSILIIKFQYILSSI